LRGSGLQSVIDLPHKGQGSIMRVRPMIERKSFLRMMKAMVLGLRRGLTDPSASIKQDIIKELVEILGVERCVIFKAGQEEVDGRQMRYCEIVAGVPLEEYEAKLHQKVPLHTHPDIEDVMRNGQICVIKDPCNDPRTEYFKDMVKKMDVAEIAYLPLPYEDDEQGSEVIVIDAVHGKEFDDDEILFCSEVAEFLGMLLGRETIMLQHLRDAIINKVVPLEGFAVKLRDNLQATLGYVAIIHREAEEISSILPRKLNKRL
jgi:hypothetical protein